LWFVGRNGSQGHYEYLTVRGWSEQVKSVIRQCYGRGTAAALLQSTGLQTNILQNWKKKKERNC